MSTVGIILLLMNTWLFTYGNKCITQPGKCRFSRLHGDINRDQKSRLSALGMSLTTPKVLPTIDPGSLVHITMSSEVSVNLDEFATDKITLDSIIAELLQPNPQFWIDRAKKQVNLATYRLTFRPLFVNDKYQLPLTQPSHWHIVLHENPKYHHAIGGHRLVSVRYTWSTHILSDYESPGISEPQLGNIGGQWVEPFILPADPYNIIQRTGYACMDECKILIIMLILADSLREHLHHKHLPHISLINSLYQYRPL
ncbi:unnamed protein product [Rotaria sp. Silwood1]|nr:unnamed protein product [Rotaria sp. Silwood1]